MERVMMKNLEKMYKLNDYTYIRFLKRLVYIFNKKSEFEMLVDIETKSFFEDLVTGVDISKYFTIDGYSELFSYLVTNFMIFQGDSIESINEQQKGFNRETQKFENRDITKILVENLSEIPEIMNINLELTDQCNEKCVHCYNGHPTESNFLHYETFIKILEELKRERVNQITLTGGEPLLHPNIKEILELCFYNKMSITLLTNGLLVDSEMIDLFKRINISMIQISLYSMNSEIHDRVTRIQGSHTKTMNAIKELRNRDINISLSSPLIQDYNLESKVELENWANQNGIIINFNQDIMDKIEKEFLTGDIKHSLKNFANSAKQMNCSAGYTTLFIAANGEIYPCIALKNLYSLGNSISTSLHEVWRNTRMSSIRNFNTKENIQSLEAEKSSCFFSTIENRKLLK